MNNQPIGVFDSGVGGTSIWKEVCSLMPNESTVYLADSKHAPYGNKSKDDILRLSIKNTEKLLNIGAKLIVVACNTATTNAIEYLRKHYDVPFIGIEPAIKPAALQSKTKKIGILATKGTLNSSLFAETSSAYKEDIKVIEVIGEGLVPLIEQGKLHSPELKNLLSSYVTPMIQDNIDYLVLGCSHYPYLLPLLHEILPRTITVIDSGEAVAKQTKSVLLKNNLKSPSQEEVSHLLYSNANTTTLEMLVNDSQNVKIEFLDF